MARLARHLSDVFHVRILSRWVWNGEETPETPAAYWATVDLADLDAADMLLIFPSAEHGTGHHVEFGYALAAGKRVVVVGERPGIFYHHPAVEWHPDLEAFYAEFGEQS